jgi:hypothetical protein
MTRKGRIMKSKGNEAVALPELERMLTVTAAGQVKESSIGIGRRIVGSRPSRIVAIGAACLAFGGTAMAATGVWDPGIGADSSQGPAEVSNTPVPTAMAGVFAVLRRDQTDQDRSPEVEATLAKAALADGVRPNSVRYLGPGEPGEATIMFSAEMPGSFSHGEEPICVDRPYAPFRDNGFTDNDPFCFGLGEVLSGHGFGMMSSAGTSSWLTVGVVPDGVATVTAQFGSAPDVTVPVVDNYWELTLSGAELSNANSDSGVVHTVWHDADGNVVPQAPGDGQ